MRTEYKHIHFEEIDAPGRKTRIFDCRNHDDLLLGEVAWLTRWRQYCFSPAEDTVFSRSCLEDIKCFMQQLMDERTKEKANGKE